MHPPLFWLVSAYAESINELVLLILSYIFCFRRFSPRYMRSFPIYATLNAAADALAEVFHTRSNEIYYGFSLFELVYFTYFLTTIFRVKGAKVALWSLTIICMLSSISLIAIKVFDFSLVGINGLSLLAECFVLILGCAEYIREIMAKPDIPELTREPAFWMVCGMFSYFSILGPTVIFSGWAGSRELTTVAGLMWSFNNYAQLISTAFFITAMVCKRKQPY